MAQAQGHVFTARRIGIGKEKHVRMSATQSNQARFANGIEKLILNAGSAPSKSSVMANGYRPALFVREVSHVQNQRTISYFRDGGFICFRACASAELPGSSIVVTVNDVGEPSIRDPGIVVAGNDQAALTQLDPSARPSGVPGPGR
jgi:hypothetical protein